MSRKIVITGAAGLLGGRLRRWCAEQGGYELVLLDRATAGDAEIFEADLGFYEARWTERFADAAAVVHLAADTQPGAHWESLARNNLDAVLNVFEAAADHGVAKVIFASSHQAVDGHADRLHRITPDVPLFPHNPYGMTKIAGERIARFYAERRGLSVICFRIGAVWPGDNRPRPEMPRSSQLKWLSDRDFCQAVGRALEVEGIDFAILNLTSENPGSPWDLTETKRLLGYQPQDGQSPPRMPPLHTWPLRLGRRIRRILRR